MPICPQCKIEIDELLVARSAEDISTFDGQAFYPRDTILTGKYEDYLCTNCHFIIAENKEDAKEFFTLK